MKRLCAECGERPPLVYAKGKHRRQRVMKDHDLCAECWRGLRAREATAILAARQRAEARVRGGTWRR